MHPTGAMLRVGDRVRVRDRPWRVQNRQTLSDTLTALELGALDAEEPRAISVVSPPDEVAILPNEQLEFDPSKLDAFSPWARAHQILKTTLVRETGLLSGARFGRVAMERYQLAPTLRLLS
jgi:hypothetical protein